MHEAGYEHCLSGDGCDEAFLGYPHVYKRARLFAKLDRFPSFFFRLFHTALQPKIFETAFGQPVRFIRNFLNIACRPMPRRGHISNRIIDDGTLRHLRKGESPQRVDSETILAGLSLDMGSMPLFRLAYHGKSMPGLNKVKQHGSVTMSGLNILSPFQHPAVVAFGQSLPENLLRSSSKKTADTQGKQVLMEMSETRELLPQEIIYQKKDSPVKGMTDSFYMGPLKQDILDAFRSLPFDYDEAFAQRMLKPKYAESLFRRNLSIGEYVMNAPAMLATYAAFNTSGKQE
jgi:hypothetical protein